MALLSGEWGRGWVAVGGGDGDDRVYLVTSVQIFEYFNNRGGAHRLGLALIATLISLCRSILLTTSL